MMREILFRGKRVKDGEWVYGNLSQYPGGNTFIEEGDPTHPAERWNYGVKEVCPATVGQYTGLIDKNGVKIFEGDIVKAYDVFGNEDGGGIVKWDNLFSGWNFAECRNMYGGSAASYEIVGNIYDNMQPPEDGKTECEEKTVCVLGTVYTIKERSESENERLSGCDGYCDWTTKEIVVEREINGNLGNMDGYARKVLRHEIVHAFLAESGLNECSGSDESWAMNETMVDWVARQGPKIYEAWKAAGALG